MPDPDYSAQEQVEDLGRRVADLNLRLDRVFELLGELRHELKATRERLAAGETGFLI